MWKEWIRGSGMNEKWEMTERIMRSEKREMAKSNRGMERMRNEKWEITERKMRNEKEEK